MNKSLIDLILFNGCWIINAYATSLSFSYLGPAVIFIATVVHLSLVSEWTRELFLLFMTATIGFSFDSLLQNLGYVKFLDSMQLIGPVWLYFQWIAFGFLFANVLDWLHGQMLLSSILGGIGGPMSYLAAERFGILTLADPRILSISSYILTWIIIMPVFLLISEYTLNAPPENEPLQ